MVIYVSNKQIVVPGEVIAEGIYEVFGEVYKIGKKYISKTVSMVELDKKTIKVIPLKGKYIPNVGDVVIGKVIDVGVTNWTLDIGSPYTGLLPASEVFSRPTDAARMDLSQVLDVGDIVVAKVISFDFSRDALLTIKESRLGKVTRGTLVEISPAKIPRVIGRKGSMLKMITELLNVDIIVGKNGRILVMGKEPEKEALAVLAIKKIEREAHVSGLTDRIRKFIESSLRKG